MANSPFIVPLLVLRELGRPHYDTESACVNEAWDQIAKLGFDEPFRRMWNFYLSYCEAGFEGGRINVGQFQLSKH